MSALTPRMPSPASIVPEIVPVLQEFSKLATGHGVPEGTIALVQLRASQINGCSVCVDMHGRFMLHAGETPERVLAVGAWRDSPLFSDAERAALAFSEAVTRLADRPDPVPDAVWDEARRHYDEKAMAGLLIGITAINAWNRLNVPTRQVAGEWAKSAAAQGEGGWGSASKGPTRAAAPRS
jgi:AhpD family alkylhydroperoxidase